MSYSLSEAILRTSQSSEYIYDKFFSSYVGSLGFSYSVDGWIVSFLGSFLRFIRSIFTKLGVSGNLVPLSFIYVYETHES